MTDAATPAARASHGVRPDLAPSLRWYQLAACVVPVLGWVVTRNWPPWGDEEHFLLTVRLFGEGLSIGLLRSYPEMSAPLTYIVYAVWGHVAGFDTGSLRLLSPVLASATIVLWLRFVAGVVPAPAVALLTVATIAANPYFLGLSVFVFTDMLALLGLSLAAVGVQRRSPWLSGLGVAVATCARQYLAFLAVAVAALAIFGRGKPERSRWLIAAMAGMVPIGLLVALWDGALAPDNALRAVYTSEGLRFDPHALSLYLASPAAYLFPLVGIVLARFRVRRTTVAVAVAAAVFVIGFPIAPSIAQTREGSFTVGFLHRFVQMIASGTIEHITFAALAFVHLLALGAASESLYRHGRQGHWNESVLFAWAGTLAFLVLMPFSYMPWEKYALPLFMLEGVVLAAVISAAKHRP